MTIMERVNGTHPKGRQVQALSEHTFKDSGITIKIRKISPMTQQRLGEAIQRELPEPQPPIVETELGPEPNAADPAYKAALAVWSTKTGLEMNKRLMRLAALEAEATLDAQAQDDVRRTRRYMKMSGITFEDDPDLTQDENDRIVYVLHVACASPEDLSEFGVAIMRRSVPTEEAVGRHIATFPGDVSGAGRVPLSPDSAIGD